LKISTLTKYADQPVVLHHLQKKMPLLLLGGGGLFALNDTFKHSNESKDRPYFLKKLIITAAVMAATMAGARGLSINGRKIFNGLLENQPLEKILKEQSHAVDHFIEETGVKDKNILEILEKARKDKLKLKDIDTLTTSLPKNHERDELFHEILGQPLEGHSCCGHNHDDFKKIWELSLLGLIPVAGGVAGGILADKVTGTGSKEATANKLKEGLFQFLANIVLCNVGAAVALGGAKHLEHKGVIKPLTRLKKMGVLLTGIIGAGILGGSAIANYVSKKVINPAFGGSDKGKIYDERKPEMLDIALHVDDVSAAGVISGFRWIEPVIPLFYFISGYRAGIGYRNGQTCTHIHVPNPLVHKNITQFADN
jgi:hypothetical protein